MPAEHLTAERGRRGPLGAAWDGEGVHFAVYSEHATAVDLCLLDPPRNAELRRFPMQHDGDGTWHLYVRGLGPGSRYGYRIDGPYQPSHGHRFNARKLLIDPYARAIGGPLVWHPCHAGSDETGGLDLRDSASRIAASVVVDTRFDWGEDRPPRTELARSVIYECHVKGMTARHPDVEPTLRGTYLGLASPPVIAHLQSLGVTAVELLPVHHAYVERHLVERGLTNYWGYAPIGFFAPDPRFATAADGTQVIEFKQMVRRLHTAGIEVILDVVFNHTGEGSHHGATVSLRGVDNSVYYRLDEGEPSRYVDYTGCGNSLNVDHPAVLKLVLDSLRYWVEQMHVDGFRFDLAATLTRDNGQPSPGGRFVSALLQDPTLATVKLIMEPWDLGPDGHLEGAFPRGICEWNARYRDCVRRYWRGDGRAVAELATRLGGSSDLFAGSRRGPTAGVNFAACHDGSTLRDLVTYVGKYNHANGEQNRDGSNQEYASNWGVEGPTDEPEVRERRMRILRSFLATLAFSQGVPMLQHGDERGRTQLGNNNAYCHDDELTWLDWSGDDEAHDLLEWTRYVFQLRHRHPVLQRRTFFSGAPIDDAYPAENAEPHRGPRDLVWLRLDGREMSFDDWHCEDLRSLAMLMHGDGNDMSDGDGKEAETLLLVVNADDKSVAVRPPDAAWIDPVPGAGQWVVLADSASPRHRNVVASKPRVQAHSLLLLAWRRQSE